MASSLKNKLNALRGARGKPKPTPRRSGLQVTRTIYPLPEGLNALNGDGLLRIGWTGRRFDLDRVCFLDTETTGLSGGAGTVAFLVGVGYAMGDGFCVEQLFMRDYSDEPEQLLRLNELLCRFDGVVTFNGRRFDLPLLSARCLMNRQENAVDRLQSLDLLYPSQRLWKLRLGSCRLANLEERVLGIHRDGDLPGSEVPQRYFDYLKTGDMSLIEDILAHNRQDIVTLGRLLAVLTAAYGTPEQLQERMDLFSVGRAMERQGDLRTAGQVYRIAARPRPVTTISALIGERYAGEANYRLFLMYRRTREYDKAVQTLQMMVERRQKGHVPLVELAKLEEHAYRDDAAALNWALRAKECAPECEQEALNRRIARLQGRLTKKNAAQAGEKTPPTGALNQEDAKNGNV